ncbi:MAG: hypothetical protein HQL63_12575 [Magnetococcales bacterium]|nr:hypothetical protein [Magnetococcales bacterium]
MNVSTDGASAAQGVRQVSVTRQPKVAEEQNEGGAEKARETKSQDGAEGQTSGGNPPYVGQNLNIVG